MFGVKRATEKPIKEAGEPASPVSGLEQKKEEIFGRAVIHTMPGSFLATKKPSGSKVKIILIAGGVLIFLGLIFGGAFLLLANLKPPTGQIVTPSVNQIKPAPSTNVNVGTNVNLNANVQVNANVNLKQNVNANIGAATSPALPNSLDSDNDGLTDSEEALYGTDPRKPDTDGDGYVDGVEVANLYDPLKPAPALLKDSGLVKKYTNSSYNYSILYPAKWLARPLDETNQEIIFASDTGEFIEVIIQSNPSRLSLADWYKNQVPNLSPNQIKTATNRDQSLSGIISLDGLTVYFAQGDNIYAITYNYGTKTELNFRTTFVMMYRSFKLGTEVASPPQGSESVETGGPATSPIASTNTNSNTNTKTKTSTNANANSNTTSAGANTNSATSNANFTP